MFSRTPVDVFDSSESLLRKHLRLASPMAFSMLLLTSYSVVDMFWVSSLGRGAIAAVTLCGMLFFLGFAVNQVLGTGVVAVIARAWGAGRREQVGGCLRDSLGAGVAAGAVFGLILALGAGTWLRWLGARREVWVPGVQYLRVAAFLFLGSMPLFIVSSAYRAVGDTLTPLWLTAISAGLNMVLDPVLIFGLGPAPALGVRGAAAASVLSMVAALATGVVLLSRRGSPVSIRWRGPVDWPAMKDILRVGFPSGLHYVLLSLSQAAMLRMVAVYGTVPVAAVGIGSRIARLSFLPCMALGAGTATLVGQFLGGGRPEQAVRSVRVAAGIALAVTAGIGGVYAGFPGPILRIFTPDPAILALGVRFLRIFACGLVFVSFSIILTRAFQGAGATLWPMVTVALRFLLFLGLGLAAMHWTRLGAVGVWLAMAAGHAFQAGLLWLAFRRGGWMKRRLESVDRWAGAGAFPAEGEIEEPE